MNGTANDIQRRSATINTNTYVSLGLLVTLLGGFWAILNTIYGARSEIINKQDKVELKLESLTTRMDKLDAQHETWSFQDQFKWSVHLQRDNVGKITVPEPESGR